MKTTKLFTLAAACAAMFFAASCSQDDNPREKARLEVRLTDAPNADIEEVWVDIKGIEINSSDDDSQGNWKYLENSHAGAYNLLELTNGIDTLLADEWIPAGKLSQIRLILGENNSIKMKDGSVHQLTTPSAQQSGLKVQVHSDLEGGVNYKLILDFDAAKSITATGNGKFNLKPVIRIVSFLPSGGNAEGHVNPSTEKTTVFALISANDTTASTYTDDKGDYKFLDLPAGSYEFHFQASDAYKKAMEAVEIKLGQVTKVDTVNLETQ